MVACMAVNEGNNMKLTTTLLSVSMVAFASQSLAQGEVTLPEGAIVEFDKILNPTVVVNPVHPFTTVQPTADIKFTYFSCLPKDFKVLTQKFDRNLEITVYQESIDPNEFNCAGELTAFDYTLQVTSDAKEITSYTLTGEDAEFLELSVTRF